MTDGKVFLDANILVYAHDVSAGSKYAIAREVVTRLWEQGCGVLSTQVLQEFYLIVTQKLPRPIEMSAAEKVIGDLLNWEVVVNDGQSILGAIQLQKRYKFSFWDSLIVHAALQAGTETLLSEDLSAGQKIRGTTIENPFLRSR
jgi:predicted nucleic acid-binding protein